MKAKSKELLFYALVILVIVFFVVFGYSITKAETIYMCETPDGEKQYSNSISQLSPDCKVIIERTMKDGETKGVKIVTPKKKPKEVNKNDPELGRSI